jgi:hypothetical protein
MSAGRDDVLVVPPGIIFAKPQPCPGCGVMHCIFVSTHFGWRCVSCPGGAR